MHATDLILHILHCEKLVKTQLGFLVYLVDREWVQRTGQSLTGFTYRKSRNRPRAEEFDDALRDLEDSNAVTVTKSTNQSGIDYKLYEAVLPPRHAIVPDVYVTVKNVMSDFASKSTWKLAERVCETPPVVQRCGAPVRRPMHSVGVVAERVVEDAARPDAVLARVRSSL